MTDPTPTRDEAVLSVDALAQEIRRVDGSHSLGAGALAEALMPFIIASAPAPASGRVDAVAVSRMDVVIALREWFGGERYARDYEYLDMQMGPQMKATLEAVFKDRRERASLSPAATPVSEAGGEAWPAQSGGLNADWVAMVLAEDARIEDGKLANGPYLAVKIAEASDTPAEVSRLRKALAHVRDHTRETSTATMAIGALAGGDVVRCLATGNPVGTDTWQVGRPCRCANCLPLSQSTSAGRVGKHLACWCRPDEACHADVLLELANRPICEAVEGSGQNLADAHSKNPPEAEHG